MVPVRTLSRRTWICPLLIVLGLVSPTAAQFLDQTEGSGLAREGTSWGAIFTDIDGDGDIDLFAGEHTIDPTLYWNDGVGHFDPNLHVQQWQNLYDRHGALILTLDADEDREVFITHGGEGGAGLEPNELYRNDGNGHLTPIAEAAGDADSQGRSRAASAADFDGDHLVDLWIGKAPNPASKNSLFRNDGSLLFSDVAGAVGLDEGWGTVGGLWGDVDDDGDPDLLVGGEEFPRPTNLFRNDGTAFQDISSIFSPPLPVVSGADLGDMDNDGDLDLAVCDGRLGVFDTFSEGDTLRFFFNTRYGENGVDGLTVPATADTAFARLRIRGLDSLVFLGPTEVIPPAALPILLTDEYVGAPSFDPGVDRGTWVWRASPGGPWEIRCSTPNVSSDTFDGWLADGSPIAGTTSHDLEDPGFVPGGPRVWRNDGGSFVETTTTLGLPGMLNPRDISWIDYDNDGDLDLHVLDMGTSASPNAPDGLFRNDGATFTDVTATEGIAGGSVGLGDGAVWGDIDQDGDLDVYLQQGAGPLTFSIWGQALLLENAGSRGNAIRIDLVGSESGVPALGARVTAHVEAASVARRVSANSWRGFQDPLRVHLGMGAAATADSLAVEWPSGFTEVYASLPPGLYRLVENRQLDDVHILTASPDTVPTAAEGAVVLETLDIGGSRLSGETRNLDLQSLTGLLTPMSVGENPDSTYSYRYASPSVTGVDTLVVTNLLTRPLRSDSLVVHVLSLTTSVAGAKADLGYALHGGTPNPFTIACRIEFDLPRGGRVEVAVYDVQGRSVRVLLSGPAEASRHSVLWDGFDERGAATPAGVYFVRLRSGSYEAVRKLVRIR
jgi:hypothetical protein